MMTYYSYLEKLDHSARTIESNVTKVQQLQKWCSTKRTKPELLSYRQFLNYITHLKSSNKPETVNLHIWSIKHYFNYQIEQGDRIENIADELKIKGTQKKVLRNLLTSDELEDLYYSYETDTAKKANFYTTASRKRNKIIVGLLVYQGLLSNNLKRMEVEHVDLRKGTVYIPSTRRNASRTLRLQPSQIMEFKEYIDDILPLIQERLDVNDQRLFPLNSSQFNVILLPILKQLKTYNQKVSNNNHLRASVIINWLGQYNIRKVQQMAGHLHICSTESYRQDNLESLHKAINEFHPLS